MASGSITVREPSKEIYSFDVSEALSDAELTSIMQGHCVGSSCRTMMQGGRGGGIRAEWNTSGIRAT